MPGLVGCISKEKNKIDTTLLSSMCSILKHREWYKTENYVDEKRGVAISHIHLGILNNTQQPFLNPDKSINIFMHGEVYNDEAANSDQLDFVCRLYQKYGVDFATNLNGSFVIIIIDKANDKIIITNDRTASKPLFYYSDGQAIYFAPEMKALQLITPLEKKLNLAAIANFLACGWFVNGEMLINDIKILDNANVMVITNSGISQHKYWSYTFNESGEDKGFKYYQNILSQLLCKAVRRRIRTNHNYGILLSGGYDSRGILGCYLAEKGDNELSTISWGYKEDVPKSDCAISKKLANRLGTKHNFYKLKPQEIVNNLREFIFLSDGLTAAFTNYPEALKIFQRIKEEQDVDIILRGDECFGWETAVFDEQSMFRILGIHYLEGMQKYKNLLKEPYYEMFCDLNSETLNALSSRCGAKDIYNRKDFFYLDQRLKHYLNPLNYIKTIEVESITPWIDNDILDFISTLPPQYRFDKYLYRKTIVGMFPQLFDEIAQKTNLIDWGYEFKTSPVLRDFVYKELIENRNPLHEFVDVNKLKSELDAFFSGRMHGHNCKLKSKIGKILKRFPAIYTLAQRCLSKSNIDIPMEIIIIRLLTLKIWCDVFTKNHADTGEGNDDKYNL